MSYLHFLLLFLGIPLALLLVPVARSPAPPGIAFHRGIAIQATVVIAFAGPANHYLIEYDIWSYAPAGLLGLRVGHVPIEEYLFFVAQTVLVGLCLHLAAARLPSEREAQAPLPLRRFLLPLLAALWGGAALLLLADWQRGTYLLFELLLFLPPLAIQVAFGADILWSYRRWILLASIPTALYLSVADGVAIAAGTWAINPALSLGLLLGGILPLEELLFFLFTNLLVAAGTVLFVAPESWARVRHLQSR